jgi:hypothetical protein
MTGLILKDAFQYGGYGLEGALLLALACRGYTRSLPALVAYVGTLFSADAIIRPWTLWKYGADSLEYFNVYWVTELILVFATFLLLCAIFRRACLLQGAGTWSFVWPVLMSTLIMVLAVSAAEFRHNFNKLFTSDYIWDFNQNLCFTCLILNTVLYLMMQHIKRKDAQLQLVVCGLGIQFAGPTANYALLHLTANSKSTVELVTYFSPMCGLVMLGLWLYAVLHEPPPVRNARLESRRTVPVAA